MVQIVDTDVEACCGTHVDNTIEVGKIKIQKAKRISDGILRLYCVAGERALKESNKSGIFFFLYFFVFFFVVVVLICCCL